MTHGLQVIFDEVKSGYGSYTDADGNQRLSREAAALWIEEELEGLNPSPHQIGKALALAQQLGAGRFVWIMDHPQRLDFILDEITKHLTGQWREEDQHEHRMVDTFARIYSGGDGPDQAA